MKTSKKIFIVFFSLLGLLMLSLLIQIDAGKKKQTDFEKKTTDLPAFNHLVLKNSPDIRLQQANHYTAFFYFETDSQAQMPIFEEKSDTLVIFWPYKDKNRDRTITCPNLKTISVENSKINIDNLQTDSLRCYAVSGEIYYNVPLNMNYLHLSLLQNSFSRLGGVKVKTIEVDVTQSEAEFLIDQTDTLKATLRNQSKLSNGKVLKTEVDSDVSSRYFSK